MSIAFGCAGTNYTGCTLQKIKTYFRSWLVCVTKALLLLSLLPYLTLPRLSFSPFAAALPSLPKSSLKYSRVFHPIFVGHFQISRSSCLSLSTRLFLLHSFFLVSFSHSIFPLKYALPPFPFPLSPFPSPSCFAAHITVLSPPTAPSPSPPPRRSRQKSRSTF